MKKLFTILLTLLSFGIHAQKFVAYDLSCEHKVNPLGIENKQPRLSWKLKGEGYNISQVAYTIRVASNADFAKSNIIWESAKVNSNESILQVYKGPALASGKKYFWQVKVWDNQKHETPWSATAFWEMGMLSNEDWKAKWIEPVQDTARRIPAAMVRKEFALSKQIQSARAYVTSHGLYELSINGKKVGDQVLTPGWTSYQARLQYQVYDITDLVKQGNNAVGAIIGDGWYRGSLGWMNNWGIWGKRLGLLCQLQIRYADGTEAMIVTDNTWKGTNKGPIVANGIYDGEIYDARKEFPGWNNTGFQEKDWQAVNVVSFPADEKIIATETVPVRKIQEIKPVKIFRTPKGTLVADMGQNMVGWIRLRVKSPAGTTISIRHAEVLDKFGEFYTENLRAAKALMQYTTKGEGDEIYEPRFTFFGFRFISIEGFPGELKPENITGIVVHSDMKPAGSFECSNALVNQLQHNIQWGQKGNFVDVPTDCPQRDERLGWTGDAQAFCRTAAFNMDVAPFFSKWLKDLDVDQYPDGRVPFVIPDVIRSNSGTSAGWGDVVTIAPWTMYQVFGDKQFLIDHYDAMKKYVEYIRKASGDRNVWAGGSVFGDWLYFKPKMENHTEPDGHTSPDMIATMFFAYSSKLLSKVAHELDKQDDEKTYGDLFNRIKTTFNQEYVTPSGRIASDSQTAYVLALMFDLLSDDLRPKAVQHLVADVKRRENHLSTGFLGTPYLCHVLSDNGQTSIAYDLLLQESFPSWLFPVKMGATTIWERWDGQKTDSTFQDKGMNSFNHYAYGAIGDWMYRVVAGMEIDKPGYKVIRIQPQPDSRLKFARASFESSYGPISSGWELNNGTLIVKVSIPPNTTATIVLPQVSSDKVAIGNSTSSKQKATAKSKRDENGNALFEVGSGEYVFTYNMPATNNNK